MVAVIVMFVGVAAAGTRPRVSAGLLLAVGGATALHYCGVLVASWRAIGEVGQVGPAGFVGLLGGLLVLAGGVYAEHASRVPEEQLEAAA
jgi:hypothetical protein